LNTVKPNIINVYGFSMYIIRYYYCIFQYSLQIDGEFIFENLNISHKIMFTTIIAMIDLGNIKLI